MDPLFFFSLAGIESGWGTSSHHESLNNPYSMGMYGDGVHNGYSVGDSFADGVIEGAKYIYEHYYLNGQTTLYAMNHNGDHSFCAGDPNWEYQVASEMAYCSYLIDNR
jgi:beta-N-acetylglucosaminidase